MPSILKIFIPMLLSCLLPVVLIGSSVVHAQSSQEEERLGILNAWVSAIETETVRLEDILQIQRLQRAYGYYIDKGFWQEAASLFLDNGTMEIGVDGVYRGRERIQELLVRRGGGNSGPGLPFGQYNHHLQLQPVITVAGDGLTAQGRWRDFSMLGQYQESAEWGDAVMENSYVKDNGVWKIRSLHLYPNFIAPYEGGWAGLEAVSDNWQSAVSRDFPPDTPATVRYRPFPEYFVPPFHYSAPGTEQGRTWEALVAQGNVGNERLRQLELQVMALARELDNLIAEREIENLQAKYGYYVDKGMWDEAAALFSENASYEFGQRGVYLGRERIRQALTLMAPQGLERGMLNNYSMLQPVISVADNNLSARGRWRSDVQLSARGEGFWGGGVYENEYVLEDGQWRIDKLHYYVTFWADYEAGWVEGTLPMQGQSLSLPPDLPPTEVYGSQPDVHLFPFHYLHPVTGRANTGRGPRR